MRAHADGGERVKIYRTTKYYGDKVWFIRYSASKVQYAAIKGAVKWAKPPWWLTGCKDHPVSLTLEVAEIPDDAWTKVEEA